MERKRGDDGGHEKEKGKREGKRKGKERENSDGIEISNLVS